MYIMLAGGMDPIGKEPIAVFVFLWVLGWRYLDRYLFDPD